jgi:hypothetical protein
MRGMNLLYWLMFQLVICSGLEFLFQTKYNIIGLGIIAMLYFVVSNIHDMFFGKEKIEVKIIK